MPATVAVKLPGDPVQGFVRDVRDETLIPELPSQILRPGGLGMLGDSGVEFPDSLLVGAEARSFHDLVPEALGFEPRQDPGYNPVVGVIVPYLAQNFVVLFSTSWYS